MSDLMNVNVKMNHKDIADLVGSRPDNVKVSIERLAESGVIQLPATQVCGRINGLGKEQKESIYVFEGEQGRRDSIVVVAQLCPEFTAKIVDRWQELETGQAQPKLAPQPILQEKPMNNDNLLSLARVVAEATATATIKVIKEYMDEETQKPLPIARPVVQLYPVQDHNVSDDEYVPIHKVSWESGLTDPTCRRLIAFAKLPTKKFNVTRGMRVPYKAFMDAVQQLIEESTPPSEKRKRWNHPIFGGFTIDTKAAA